MHSLGGARAKARENAVKQDRAHAANGIGHHPERLGYPPQTEFIGGTGKRRFWETTVNVVLLSGVLVWIFAREAYHVGASGLVFGYFGVIMARAYTERGIITIAIAIVTVMAYGGLLWGVLPMRSYVSFESHLFGLIAGIVVVWLDRKFRKSQTP